MDDLEVLQSTHAHAGCSVEIEHEERRRDRDESAWCEGGETVGDRGHGVFADSIVNITTGIVAVDATICAQIRLTKIISVICQYRRGRCQTYMLKILFARPRHVHRGR